MLVIKVYNLFIEEAFFNVLLSALD